MCIWRSEDSSRELLLSFRYVGPEDRSQVTKLYPLSHLGCPLPWSLFCFCSQTRQACFSGICPSLVCCRHFSGLTTLCQAPSLPSGLHPPPPLLDKSKPPLITHCLVFFAFQPSLRVDPQTGQFGSRERSRNFSKMLAEKATFPTSAWALTVRGGSLTEILRL